MVMHATYPNVTVVGNTAANALLARIRRRDISRYDARQFVRLLYGWMMIEVVNQLFPRKKIAVQTSMHETHGDQGVWHGEVPDPDTQVVILDIPRGGIVPSESCHDQLALLGIDSIRADVIMMNRTHGHDGRVTGVAVQGRKTGTNVDGAIVLYPDCMLATGASLIEARRHYEMLGGAALQHIMMVLIAAPQGIEAISKAYPDTQIFINSVDFDLTDEDFILPGGGDMGNKLNGPSDVLISAGSIQ